MKPHRYIEEVPENPCTREEFRRTLKIIGGSGNYLKSPHLAVRTPQKREAFLHDDGIWRQ
jgi:hypothetical protein